MIESRRGAKLRRKTIHQCNWDSGSERSRREAQRKPRQSPRNRKRAWQRAEGKGRSRFKGFFLILPLYTPLCQSGAEREDAMCAHKTVDLHMFFSFSTSLLFFLNLLCFFRIDSHLCMYVHVSKAYSYFSVFRSLFLSLPSHFLLSLFYNTLDKDH